MTTNTFEISPRDLPDWMRQAQRGFDWGALLIFAFSLIIAMPFLTQPSLPHTNASENYVYRTADYATAFTEGRFYPRWAADTLGGYGAPIPHYYPPLPAYLPALLQVLFTNDPVQSVRMVFAGAIGLAGLAVYAFVSHQAGARAGILAGFLYTFSPYVGLTAPHILGDLPGVMTLALIPTLLWCMYRLLRFNRPADILMTALAFAALCLTSIRGAGAGLTLSLVFVALTQRPLPRVRLFGSLLLGLGIASFYWLPMFMELSAVQWRAPLIQSAQQVHFFDLFSLLRPLDPAELISTPQFSLGIVQLLLAIIAGVIGWQNRAKTRSQNHFLLTGFVLVIVLAFVFPGEVWLTGLISLCLAIGGSSVMLLFGRISPRFRRLLLPALLILIWISASPIWLTRDQQEDFGSTDSKTLIQYEQQGYGIAVLPAGLPIPVTIPQNLAYNRTLIEGYMADTINKIAPGQMSQNFQAGILDHNTHRDAFQIRADSPILLNILTAYFPGWQATLNGRPLLVTPNRDTGLIEVDIPIVRGGELVVELNSTAPRTGAWIIAWACLSIGLVITWGRLRRRRRFFEDINRLSNPELRLLTVLMIAFGGIIFVLNYASLPFSLDATPGYQLQGTTTLQARSDSGLNLLAYRLPNNQYRAGETLNLELYWQAQRFLNANYQVKVYLLNNRDRQAWSSTNLHHPSNYPTSRWTTGLYVNERYAVQLADDIPPGNYLIAVEAYSCLPTCETGRTLSFFSSTGQLIGNTVTLPILVSISS